MSFVTFVVLHVPVWGAGHLVTISATPIVFAVLYVHSRRLGPVVVMHFLSDVVLLFVLPALGWT